MKLAFKNFLDDSHFPVIVVTFFDDDCSLRLCEKTRCCKQHKSCK